MRLSVGFLTIAMVLAAGAALAAPPSPARVVVDRGLHRQWLVERDAAHPERPPRLVEVPWSDARAAQSPMGSLARPGAPLVRAGMAVSVVERTGAAELHLAGTALRAGWSGDTVPIRAGLHGAVRRGIVRGPGLVELLPGEAGN